MAKILSFKKSYCKFFEILSLISYNFDKFTWICSWKSTKSDKNMTFQKSPNLEPHQLGSFKFKKEPVNSIWSPIWSHWLLIQFCHFNPNPKYFSNNEAKLLLSKCSNNYFFSKVISWYEMSLGNSIVSS